MFAMSRNNLMSIALGLLRVLFCFLIMTFIDPGRKLKTVENMKLEHIGPWTKVTLWSYFFCISELRKLLLDVIWRASD